MHVAVAMHASKRIGRPSTSTSALKCLRVRDACMATRRNIILERRIMVSVDCSTCPGNMIMPVRGNSTIKAVCFQHMLHQPRLDVPKDIPPNAQRRQPPGGGEWQAQAPTVTVSFCPTPGAASSSFDPARDPNAHARASCSRSYNNGRRHTVGESSTVG